MARNIYGLDLGTYEIKVYDKNNNKIWTEKDVVAIRDKKELFAIGDEAYTMFEKNPQNIQVLFPMRGGVISRFNDMQYLLQALLSKDKKYSKGAEYVIAVPTDVTEVEKRAFFDLMIHSSARAREVNVVERGVADAIGLGLDVKNAKGLLIANFGGETTELSVLSSGGMVLNRLTKIGGVSFDESIVNLVRHNNDFLIGRLTAENLRRQFGVFEDSGESAMTVAGRNLITGIPQYRDISVSLVRAAIKEPLKECVNAITSLLERTPPEVLSSIQEQGIFITGGLANLRGLPAYIEGAIGLRVHVAKDPDVCAVRGLQRIIESEDLKKLAFSMLDDNYRWMR